MALERKDLVQDTATSTGTGAFVMAGTPAAGFQAFSVHTNGATFDYKAAAGAQWEVGIGTWNGSNIARSPTASSNANALVNFTTAPTVTEVVSAASVAAFLRAADGVDVSTLSAVGSLNTGDSVLLLRGGTLYTALASLFGSTNTTTPTQVITVNNPGPQTVGVTYTASGTYTNGTPTALDFSVDGGTNWTAVPSPTIGGGNFSFSSTPSTASASRQMMVRDHTTLISGTSTAYVVSAAPATDTTAPTAVSAAVANATPTAVVITMSEAMNTTFVPAASAFTVGGHTVSSAAVSGSTISLTVDAFVNGEAARTVAYTQPGTNNARDLAGNLLANFTGLVVTNNVAAAGGAAYDTLTNLVMTTAIGSPPTYAASGASNYNDNMGGYWSKHFAAGVDGYVTLQEINTDGYKLELHSSSTDTSGAQALVNLENAYGMGYQYYINTPTAGGTIGALDASIKVAANDQIKMERINSSGAAGNTATVIFSAFKAGTWKEIGRVTNLPNGVLYPRWTAKATASCTNVQSSGLV